jgi:membrane protein DedA with SNARE-associated domain
MSLARFTTLNVVSACVWAAAHLVPGLSVGWTLTSYIEIEGWLDAAVELAAVVVAIGLTVWVVRLVFNWRRPLPDKPIAIKQQAGNPADSTSHHGNPAHSNAIEG